MLRVAELHKGMFVKKFCEQGSVHSVVLSSVAVGLYGTVRMCCIPVKYVCLVVHSWRFRGATELCSTALHIVHMHLMHCSVRANLLMSL